MLDNTTKKTPNKTDHQEEYSQRYTPLNQGGLENESQPLNNSGCKKKELKEKPTKIRGGEKVEQRMV